MPRLERFPASPPRTPIISDANRRARIAFLLDELSEAEAKLADVRRRFDEELDAAREAGQSALSEAALQRLAERRGA
jgi:hypothetical protein